MSFDIGIILNNYHEFMYGLAMTFFIVAVSLSLGSAFGLILCICSIRKAGVLFQLARAFINFFRTTPEIVLIFWFYFCLPPILNIRLSSFSAGLTALSLVAAAFLSEIFRAGVLAISSGQLEAAKSLSIRRYCLWRKIIIPQATRRMMPPLVNYLADLFKISTLLSAIGVHELSFAAYSIGARTFRYLETLTFVAVIFFAIIVPISLFARWLERRLGKIRGD